MHLLKHYLKIYVCPSFSVANVHGHARNEDMIAFFDAYLPSGDKCGQQKPITGLESLFVKNNRTIIMTIFRLDHNL